MNGPGKSGGIHLIDGEAGVPTRRGRPAKVSPLWGRQTI